MSVILEKVNLPGYSPDRAPDFKQAGTKLDDLIRKLFYEKEVLIRCISSGNHPGKTVNDLLSIIQQTGTDKYDPKYESFWEEWDVYQQRKFDLFASRKVIDEKFSFAEETLELFYEGALADRGYRVMIDIIMIYDIHKFEMIPIYFSETEIEETWKFKEQHRKEEALLGIIEIIVQ